MLWRDSVAIWPGKCVSKSIVDQLGQKMKTIVDADKAEDKATLVEEALVDIWAYSKEQNIVLDASATPFGGDGLDIMLHARELAHANQMSIGID